MYIIYLVTGNFFINDFPLEPGTEVFGDVVKSCERRSI
jgi:hypothetical protein